MTRNPVRPIHFVPQSPGRGPRRRTGFTMIEMLTVIGIIVILMAILLPAVSKVRQQVRVALTQQEMTKIAGAIDQYYSEYKSYPGPISNLYLNPTVMLGISPSSNAPTGAVAVSPTSTENMVLGVCGGLELQGGLVVYNSNDIQGSLGPLSMNANKAKQTRHPAFIDATPGERMPNLPWDGSNGMTGMSDSYIPEFMDHFNTYGGGVPRPILYLRARVGNPVSNGATITAPDDTTTQYNYNHLTPYADPNVNDFNGNFAGSGVTPLNPSAVYYTSWQTYLANPNVLNTPRGANAYILISAGVDGVFGTTDDLFYP